MTNETGVKLGNRQKAVLLEAARRWLTADDHDRKNGLELAWTGLGSATVYAPAVSGGFMVCATSLNPGHSTWWRLTDKGAAVVRRWIDGGLRAEHFRTDWTGGYSLVEQPGVSLSPEGVAAVA